MQFFCERRKKNIYIRQVNRVKLADIVFTFVFLSVCVSVRSQSHWFEWAEWRIVHEKCIWLVREKLTLFLYGQDIVGNVVLLAYCLALLSDATCIYSCGIGIREPV